MTDREWLLKFEKAKGDKKSITLRNWLKSRGICVGWYRNNRDGLQQSIDVGGNSFKIYHNPTSICLIGEPHRTVHIPMNEFLPDVLNGMTPKRFKELSKAQGE